MRRFILILALAATLYATVLLGYYKLVLKSPPIPLGTINLPVSGTMSDAMDLVEVENLVVEWNTNGEIDFITDSELAATISYDLDSLGNATDLAMMFLVPQSNRWMMEAVKKVFTIPRLQFIANSKFFYYFMPLQLTFSFST